MRSKWIGRVGFVWGVGGVLLLLADALIRLVRISGEAFSYPLDAVQWSFVVGWTFVMVFVEGQRGFHQSFSPRVVARAFSLLERPRLRDVVLAPFFCMGLYRTTRRRLIAGWGMAAGIVSLILIVRTLAQPWRGLVDFGVVVALSYGFGSTVVWLRRALAGEPLPFGPELGTPEEALEAARDSAREARDLGRAPIA